ATAPTARLGWPTGGYTRSTQTELQKAVGAFDEVKGHEATHGPWRRHTRSSILDSEPVGVSRGATASPGRPERWRSRRATASPGRDERVWVEARHGFAGARRALGIEARHGFAGAPR